MSLIGIFHRYTYIFHGYSGISVVFRYFGDSRDPKTCIGSFLSCILFSFFFIWALKRMQSCTNVDAFSKVRHTSTGFPKRCDQILISDKKKKKQKKNWKDKDIFKR